MPWFSPDSRKDLVLTEIGLEHTGSLHRRKPRPTHWTFESTLKNVKIDGRCFSTDVKNSHSALV